MEKKIEIQSELTQNELNSEGGTSKISNLSIEVTNKIGSRSSSLPPTGNPDITCLKNIVDEITDSETDALIHLYFFNRFNCVPRLNLMDGKVYVGRNLLSDDDISEIRVALDNHKDKENLQRKSNGMRTLPLIPKDRIKDVITTFARKVAYHPFKQYVESVPWDNYDHLGKLYEALTLSENYKQYGNFYRICFAKFFVSLVRKVYINGSRNFVIILQGSQGIGKSRFIEKLMPVPGAFGEGAIDPERPDNLAHHAEKLLWHIEEFDALTNKKDVAAIKAYVDKSSVTFRRPYDKYSITEFSQLSFIASVNTVDFLKDATGSRRYIIIPVDKMNAAHGVNLQQVYAQAKAIMDSGDTYWLTKEDETVQAEINANFAADSLADLIIENIAVGSDYEWLSVTEIIEKVAKKTEMSGLRQVNKSELRNKIERLGFSSRQKGNNAKQFNVKVK